MFLSFIYNGLPIGVLTQCTPTCVYCGLEYGLFLALLRIVVAGASEYLIHPKGLVVIEARVR